MSWKQGAFGWLLLLTIIDAQSASLFRLFPTNYTAPTPANENIINTRIINGQDAPRDRFTWIALYVYNGYTQACGGSLIARDMVITNTHCWSPGASDLGVAILGTLLRSELEPKFTVIERFSHPEYVADPPYNDVAIIKLEGVPESFQPIQLNFNPDFPSEAGTELTILGWGSVTTGENGVLELAETLQMATTQYVPFAECAVAADPDTGFKYGTSTTNTGVKPDWLCVHDSVGATCTGDSGGPVIREGVNPRSDLLVSVISGASGECDNQYLPQITQKISYHKDWIVSIVCASSQYPPDYFNCPGSTPTAPAPTAVAPTIAPVRAPTSPPTIAPVPVTTNQPTGDLSTASPFAAPSAAPIDPTDNLEPTSDIDNVDSTPTVDLEETILPTIVALPSDPTVSPGPTISPAPTPEPTVSQAPSTSHEPTVSAAPTKVPTVSPAPTVTPGPTPISSPVEGIQQPESEREDDTTSPPAEVTSATISPSPNSPATTPTKVTVYVKITFDDKPQEIGWMIADAGYSNFREAVPMGAYLRDVKMVNDQVDVEGGEDYIFIISDKSGNGLSGGGSYEVFLGEDFGYEVLASGAGDFGDNATTVFSVPCASGISCAPSAKATGAPNIPPVPTITPTISIMTAEPVTTVAPNSSPTRSMRTGAPTSPPPLQSTSQSGAADTKFIGLCTFLLVASCV